MLFQLYVLGKISKRRLLGTARVIVYGTVVAAGLGALTIRNAVADAQVQSLELGRKLEGLQDLAQGAQSFQLNGQTVYFSATKSDDTVGQVLDRFEAHCTSTRAFDAIAWATKDEEKQKLIDKSGISRFGILRKEDTKRDDGVVMCFTKNTGPRNILTALQDFQTSGDLHDLGDARYVHAVHKSSGRTFIQVMWTEGSFNVRSIMGTPGQDTIGSDFATIPRPSHSTRTMTAQAVGTPYAARVYESTDAPETVLSAYSNKMLSDGWSSVTSPDVSMNKMGLDGRYFIRPETSEQAVVTVTKSTQNKDKTMVVVASVGATPTTDHLKGVAE